MKELIEQFGSAIQTLADWKSRIDAFLSENLEDIKQLAIAFQNFPNNTLPHWEKMAKFGWYLNWQTPMRIVGKVDEGQEALNAYMIEHLENDFEELATKVIELYPHRKHILDVAFDLHRNGNYIACIPLFFSQLDGMCGEKLKKNYFEKQEELQAKVDELLDGEIDAIHELNLQILLIRTQFQAGSSSKSRVKKSLAPTRNGILHGSRKHLDYGKKENSFKAFSLLCFVASCFDTE